MFLSLKHLLLVSSWEYSGGIKKNEVNIFISDTKRDGVFEEAKPTKHSVSKHVLSKINELAFLLKDMLATRGDMLAIIGKRNNYQDAKLAVDILQKKR